MFQPGKPTFAALDSVPWADLQHAYGSAADIPEHFRQLVTGKRKVREGVFSNFYGNIFHQGSVYPATVAAIPFLQEALCYTDLPDRYQVLVLLAHLALGFPEDLVVTGFDLEELLGWANPLVPRQETDDEEDGCRDEFAAEIARQCYAEVGAGCPIYTALLDADDAQLQIGAAFVLGWFPAHAWSAGPRLLALGQDASAHPLVRCSCLLALSHCAARATRQPFLEFVSHVVAEASAAQKANEPIAALEATACLCLLREHYRTRDRNVPAAARELAEACFRAGVGSAADGDSPPDEAVFPWGLLVAHLQKVIRKLLRKPKRKKHATQTSADNEAFDVAALVSQLRNSTSSGEAVQLGQLLLTHAFGEKFHMTFADRPERTFPVDDWNDEQRAILQAIVSCKAAWPEIGYWLQEAMELEFEPRQEELRAALDRPAGAEAESDTPPTFTGEPDEVAVLAAVRHLVDSFSRDDCSLDRELERFAPFRPHAGIGVPQLVEQLKTGKLKERKAAAWALGRIGPVARAAVPALFEAWRRDRKNEYAHSALSDIGLDDFEPLIELMRGKSEEMAEDACWVFGALEDVPSEIIQRLLGDENPQLRHAAIGKLRFKAAAQHVPQLLQLLDDQDQSIAIQARYGLSDAGPQCLPALLAAAENAAPTKRQLLAQVLADFSRHLTPEAPRLARWLLQEADPAVRLELLRSLSHLESVPADVVSALTQIATTDTNATVREQSLRTMAQLEAVAAAELAPVLIQVAENDSDPHIRASAIQMLRSFRQPQEKILAALDRAVGSALQPVRLQAIWALYYRGAEGVPLLLEHLPRTQDDRVMAEIAWGLGLLKADSALSALQKVQSGRQGLASSVAGWALEQIQGDG